MAASHNAMLGKECLSARLLEVIQWSFWEKSIKNEYTDFSNSSEVVWEVSLRVLYFVADTLALGRKRTGCAPLSLCLPKLNSWRKSNPNKANQAVCALLTGWKFITMLLYFHRYLQRRNTAFKHCTVNAFYMLFFVRDLCLDINSLYVCKLIVVSSVLWFQSAQAALQVVNTVQCGNVGVTSTFAAESGLPPGHSSVLRIIIENLFYPVSLEVLYQVIRISKTNSKICFFVATINRFLVCFFFFLKYLRILCCALLSLSKDCHFQHYLL